MRATIAMLALALAAASASADPAAAKKANNEGMRLYKEADYEQAIVAFERAIAEAPALVKAHYNRASMAALLGRWDVLTEEMAWLRASKDKEASACSPSRRRIRTSRARA